MPKPMVNPLTSKFDFVSETSDWTPSGVTFSTVGGIASGTNLGVSPVAIEDTLTSMFYPATAPSVSLSSNPSGGLREKGNSASTVTLTATTVKHTNNITSVKFYRGATLIHTVPSPIAGGGVESYIDTTPVTSNTTYTCVVSDGVLPDVTSNTITFTFISAYYYGVGAQGLSPTEVSGLTKAVIANTATRAVTTSPTNQVYYFAYPDSYNALTSILDNNGFETISDYTVTTGNSITNTYGNSDTYRIYEFNNLTTQTNFTNTYKQ